jgi:hypothetical protein
VLYLWSEFLVSVFQELKGHTPTQAQVLNHIQLYLNSNRIYSHSLTPLDKHY